MSEINNRRKGCLRTASLKCIHTACLALQGIKPYIIDAQDASHHARGRGDALQCRTIEVMRSIGLGQEMIEAGVKMFTRTVWDMTADPPSCTSRSDFYSSDIDCEDAYR